MPCRTSPNHGRKLVNAGRDLRDGLDHVRALCAAGLLGAQQAGAIVSATTDLDTAESERTQVDHLLANHDLTRMKAKTIRDLGRSIAAQVAPEKFRARTETARAGRRVTLRPGEDGTERVLFALVANRALTPGSKLAAAG